MAKGIKSSPIIPGCKKRKIQCSFDGGSVTSDAGSILLRAADRRLNLTKNVASSFTDNRRKNSCSHKNISMLRQRIYGIASGYEDLNDHDQLRNDVAFQTAVEEDKALASSPTLCRFENRIDRSALVGMQKAMLDTFVASHKQAPKELILDFDGTHDRVHGVQDGRHYHRHYGSYCFLPLYVFCGQKLLVSYLRPGDAQDHYHAVAIIRLLVTRLRNAWPNVKIMIRADAGFGMGRLFSACERLKVDYIIGIQRYNTYKIHSQDALSKATKKFADSNKSKKVFHYSSFRYGAQSKAWRKNRRIIIKAESDDQGSSVRYLVTNLKGRSKHLVEDVYNMRGDMENRIKEQKLGLHSDRTSCSEWYANQFRIFLSSMAYILMEEIRSQGLKNSAMEKAQIITLRSKIIKIGAAMTRNTRSIKFHCSSTYPFQNLFFNALMKLSSA